MPLGVFIRWCIGRTFSRVGRSRHTVSGLGWELARLVPSFKQLAALVSRERAHSQEELANVWQKVLCINDRQRVRPDGLRAPEVLGIAVGSVYTIQAVYQDDWDGFPVVSLVEVEDIETEEASWGFCSSRFRPIDDPSIEIFRQMVKELSDA